MPKFTEPLLIELGPPTMALLRNQAEYERDSAWWTALHAPGDYYTAKNLCDILCRHQRNDIREDEEATENLEVRDMDEYVAVLELAEEVFGKGYVVKVIEDAADATTLEGESNEEPT